MRLKVPYKVADKLAGRVADNMDKLSAKTNVLNQAGGGVTGHNVPEEFVFDAFEEPVMAGLKTAFHNVNAKGRSFDEWVKHMSGDHGDAEQAATEQDLTHPLSNYFISTSHNTYLTGHQLYGRANVEGYRNVLLRGCRSVEIDVWDGELPSSSESSSDEEETKPTTPKASSSQTQRVARWQASERAEPVVLHGYTATKDVSFRKVCETIRDNAFVMSKLPVIVSLEVHASHEQQELMVDIIKDAFRDFLVDEEFANVDPKALPSPAALHEKILIKVKYSPPGREPVDEHPEKLSKVSSQTSRSSSSSDQEQQQGKPNKIIDSLSRMGVYTRSYHYKGLSGAEASAPRHIFSLSEGTLSEVRKSDPVGLFNHNRDYMMRAYPKATRISSSNLDPALYWRHGVQMVALNWQRIDAGVMLNEAMFSDTGGWVLKPQGYRSDAEYPGEVSGHGSHLSIQLIAAQNLNPPEGIDAHEFKPYVKCELHMEIPSEWENMTEQEETKKDGEFKDQSNTFKGIHPDFGGQLLNFKELPSIVPELGFVRFKIMHSRKISRDPLAAWACIRLDRLKRGYRFIHVFDAKGVQTKGVMLVKIDYEWKLIDSKASRKQPTVAHKTAEAPSQSIPEQTTAAPKTSAPPEINLPIR